MLCVGTCTAGRSAPSYEFNLHAGRQVNAERPADWVPTQSIGTRIFCPVLKIIIGDIGAKVKVKVYFY